MSEQMAPNFMCKKEIEGKECGSIEFDIHIFNATLLINRCRKCGQHYKVQNPSYPLTVRAALFPKKDAVVQVIDDEGVKAMLTEKDQENEALREKLLKAGIDPDA